MDVIDIDESYDFTPQEKVRMDVIIDACNNENFAMIPSILIGLGVTGDEIVKYKIFENVCSKGKLIVAKYLVNLYGIDPDYIKNMDQLYVWITVTYGHFKVIKWLEEEYNVLDEYMKKNKWSKIMKNFSMCCGHGSLAMIKWLADAFNITHKNFYKVNYGAHEDPLNNACSNGKKRNAEWITERFSIGKSNTFLDNTTERNYLYYMCSRTGAEDNLEVIMWYVNRFNLTRKNLRSDKVLLSIFTCCDYGNIESAKWLVNRFEITQEDIISALDIDRYKEVIINACNNGIIEVLEWIVMSFGALDKKFIELRFYDNIILGNIESGEWLLEAFKLDIRKIAPNPLSAVEDIIMESSQIVPTLKWFQRHYNCSFKDMFSAINDLAIRAPRERFGSTVIRIDSNMSFIRTVFSRSNLEDIEWFVKNFNITENDIYTRTKPGLRPAKLDGTSEGGKDEIEPLGSAYGKSSLKLVEWGVEYFNFNKDDILNSLRGDGPLLESSNILNYLKNRYGITKEDIMADNYFILRNVIEYGENQISLIIFMDIFGISREELSRAVEVSYEEGELEVTPSLKYILNSYNVDVE